MEKNILPNMKLYQIADTFDVPVNNYSDCSIIGNKQSIPLSSKNEQSKDETGNDTRLSGFHVGKNR
jgi:hypothetical protein